MPLADAADLILFYAPNTRSIRALWMLEELDVPYRLHHVDMQRGEHKQPDFLKLNPSGKLPTVVDQGIPISESGAIMAYLADKYAPGRLAPFVHEPERAAYLKWMFYCSGVMEPVYGEKFFGWDLPASRVGWGDFATMLKVVTEAVDRPDWLTGARFTAADLFMGSNLYFGMNYKILPQEGPIAAFAARCLARPAAQRAHALEQGFIKAREKATA